MFTRFKIRWGIALGLIIAGIFAIIAVSSGSSTQAASDNNGRRKGLFQRTTTLPEDYPRFWDIREAKGEDISQLLEKYRTDNRKSAASVADIRDRFVQGEANFTQKHPHAVVEYNTDIIIDSNDVAATHLL